MHLDPECSWIRYQFAEDEDINLAHSGSGIMMIQPFDSEQPDAENQQVESMITHPGNGAVYMDFWYYLYPTLLEDGADRNFPDHYYVEISRDNGENWTELWDGRWDMGNEDAVQQASLFLGEPADENTLVRFRAVSGEEESLYYLWAVDDIEFFSASDTQAAPSLRAARAEAAKTRISTAIAGLKTHRQFTPSGEKITDRRRIPQEEWANAGNTSWRISLDGEPVFNYLKARHYTDASASEGGQHTYSVCAWSEKDDREYAAATIDVNIEKFDFRAPTNVQAYCEPYEQEPGKYAVGVRWSDPEGEYYPYQYIVNINGKLLGMMPYGEEYDISQILPHGVYEIEVMSNYVNPDGYSEPIRARVAAGTVLNPYDLKAEEQGNGYLLTWAAPEGPEAPAAYTVYRGDEEIASSCTELTYLDSDVPDGKYTYSVHAVYPAEVSLPAEVKVVKGELAPVALPISTRFDKGHLPAGWDTELVDTYNRVKDMYGWRFDNWFGTIWPWNADSRATGMSADFASISGVAAGMSRIESYIISPDFNVTDKTAVSFTKYFEDNDPGPSGRAMARLQISIDGGESWNDLLEWDSQDETSLTDLSASLASYYDCTARLRWGFTGRNSGIAALSNVLISDASGVDNILGGNASAILPDVYTLQGICVARAASAEKIAQLPAGIYLLRTPASTRKIVVK